MCWPRTLRPGPDGTGALQKCRSWRSPWSERESQPRAMHRGGGTRTQTGHARTVGTVQRAMSCPVPFRTAGRGRARERSRRDRGHRAPCRAVACCSRQSAPAVPLPLLSRSTAGRSGGRRRRPGPSAAREDSHERSFTSVVPACHRAPTSHLRRAEKGGGRREENNARGHAPTARRRRKDRVWPSALPYHRG